MMLRLTSAMGAGLLVLAGCASAKDHDPFDDEKSVTEVSALDVETSSAELDGLQNVDAVQAARSLAATKIEGCRTRTVDPQNPSVVHVTLTGCTDHFGKHVINGELTITFSQAADGRLHAESVSNDLTVDGRAFSRRVSSDIAISGDVRTVTRHVEKSGTKANGDSIVRTADEVVVVDSSTGCRTVNGTGHALVAGTRQIDSTITNLQTCKDLCPTGSVEHVVASKGKTVVATFDGSTTATIDISKPKGDTTKTWPLECTPR
ncbi:MAG: hypothetical protein ACXWUG_07590 [Polyangiales bacterium]